MHDRSLQVLGFLDLSLSLIRVYVGFRACKNPTSQHLVLIWGPTGLQQ